jgi:hypothetical protein
MLLSSREMALCHWYRDAPGKWRRRGQNKQVKAVARPKQRSDA